ncbi:bifunctional 2-polyprenyl-6-hydroxyphenol methylase/3-demethylubiquinol 3-O-methyltransferase UbiG [Geobacter sp. SVR]|uniref:class I SAM-dependent methyltransferase n=1 Tax=Geobacter sp. SVR TaxID=2495594 RepID=UPI00143EF6EF|nr:class I SAM-dependent methyltransferase [Geobacter sp. SVR]BCS55004.1 type 12 methyltransferase [Geobacter sp. SVR]GCF85186.1 type 12 methyltransferase [Geobacter sp. SVR]
MNSAIAEKKRLQTISEISLYSSGVMPAAISYCFKIVSRFINGESILELGPAEGVMTELLATLNKKITIVEGSSTFCDDLRKRFPQAEIVNALFEEFNPTVKFDTIILGHVLEHVNDPVDILSRAKNWLKPDVGHIFAAVPNAHSLHRQAAVVMGILTAEDTLNEMDVHHGHRRVFNPESFQEAFHVAGLNIEVFGGYWLKPVANKQIEDTWTPQMVEAFMQLGERFPDIAGEIYIVASHNTGG